MWGFQQVPSRVVMLAAVSVIVYVGAVLFSV